MKLQDMIDASVFVECLISHHGKANRLVRDACLKYVLHLTNEIIEGYVSYGTLGEIWLAVRQKVQQQEQEADLVRLHDLLDKCHIIAERIKN